VRVIAVSALKAFWVSYPDAEQPLKSWFDEASNANWKTPAEIKHHYRSASILKSGRVVFNIAGNKYRLVVALLFNSQTVLIKFVGTHNDYDKIDAQTISLNLREADRWK
jgi:mRNA interferase HigB